MCAPSAAPCPEGPQRAQGFAVDALFEAGELPAFERVMGSRRAWRRIAKRATAAYERDLAKLARRIAATAPPVGFATSRPLRGTGDAAVVVLTLSLPGWELELAGIAAGAAGAAEGIAAGTAGTPRLTRTGRYGAFWWIELSGTASCSCCSVRSYGCRASGAGDGPSVDLHPAARHGRQPRLARTPEWSG